MAPDLRQVCRVGRTPLLIAVTRVSKFRAGWALSFGWLRGTWFIARFTWLWCTTA